MFKRICTAVRRVIDQTEQLKEAHRTIARLGWELHEANHENELRRCSGCTVSTAPNTEGESGWDVTMHIPVHEAAALRQLPQSYVRDFIDRVAREMVCRAVFGVLDRKDGNAKSKFADLSPSIVLGRINVEAMSNPLTIGQRQASGSNGITYTAP
jgi:hypothetical protein